MAVTFTQPKTRLVKRVVRFTGTGTFVVPEGVTYAVATCIGGGGGFSIVRKDPNTEDAPSNVFGSPSSVDFPVPVSAPGGNHGAARSFNSASGLTLHATSSSFAEPNSGRGGAGSSTGGSTDRTASANMAGSGAVIVGGSTVTPGASIAVTVGQGGTGNALGASGGSGSVTIEFQEEVFV